MAAAGRGRRRSLQALALLVLALAGPSLTEAQEDAPLGGGVLVQYAEGQAEQVRAEVAARGCTVVREVAAARTLQVLCPGGASGGGGDVGAASAPQSINLLAGMPGVLTVEPNGRVSIPVQPVVSATAADAAAAGGQCAATDPTKPDAAAAAGAATSEFTPYGISMVQANDPELVGISKQTRGRVLYCVIDTGLDRRNSEFPADVSGCAPGRRPGAAASEPVRACMRWNSDVNGHGTHTSGTIAAVRNGKGVVGVSAEGAQLYHHKFLDDTGNGAVMGELVAYEDCVAELDQRKKTNPGLKMVVSMSFGSPSFQQTVGTYLTNLAQKRKDILWFAAAGNDGEEKLLYPAAYPEVVAVGAVDKNSVAASFSNRGSHLELAAPGVGIVSTTPLQRAQRSDVYFVGHAPVTTEPAVPEAAADASFFARPPSSIPIGGGVETVSGPLVDCGLGLDSCENATGAICLIQRGQINICFKVASCMEGGGVGAIIYNAADKPACESMPAITLEAEGCLAVTYPTTILMARQQGEALRNALAAGTPVTATLQVPTPPADKTIATLSGTSMATPAAAGVAGLVWSAHPNCTSGEVRAALRRSARKVPGMNGATRDNAYGHGVVQALAAHRFLQANICAADRATATVVLRVTPSRTAKGKTVTARVTVTDAVTRKPLAKAAVRLALGASGAGLLSCKSLSLTTNASGVASTSCTVQRQGSTTLVARMAGSKAYKPAASTSASVVSAA